MGGGLVDLWSGEFGAGVVAAEIGRDELWRGHAPYLPYPLLPGCPRPDPDSRGSDAHSLGCSLPYGMALLGRRHPVHLLHRRTFVARHAGAGPLAFSTNLAYSSSTRRSPPPSRKE